MHGFEGMYAINEKGHVFSYPKKTLPHLMTKPRLLTTSKNSLGYVRVSLRDKSGNRCGRFIHRLLMQTFCPVEGMERLQVNHKNCIKHDNRLSNLEWVTAKENIRHARENNLMPPPSKKARKRMSALGKKRGAENGKAVSVPVVSIHPETYEMKKYDSIMDASRDIGKHNNSIHKAIRKKPPYKCHGLYWCRVKDLDKINELVRAVNELKK